MTAVASEAVRQFNGGYCGSCGSPLRESRYVGGDHDPVAECPNCGREYGCWVCDETKRKQLASGS